VPLSRSKSDAAFDRNVAELIRAGHPRAQALAAAYRMQREAKEARESEEVRGGFGMRMTKTRRKK
jgi:hypothetical protein